MKMVKLITSVTYLFGHIVNYCQIEWCVFNSSVTDSKTKSNNRLVIFREALELSVRDICSKFHSQYLIFPYVFSFGLFAKISCLCFHGFLALKCWSRNAE